MIADLIAELESIAEKNEYQFRYRIDIEPLRGGRLEFSFVCEEVADQQAFLSGTGDSIESAVIASRQNIASACKAWGCKQ